MKSKVASVKIVDSGIGNSTGVLGIFNELDVAVCTAVAPEEITLGDLVVLPGVGAFDAAVQRLRDFGWVDALVGHVNGGGALMGICLGMQLLCYGSDEGNEKGLGLIPGRFEHLGNAASEASEKCPNMGWRHVMFSESVKFKFGSSSDRPRFYFAHSFRYSNPSDEFVIARTTEGLDVVAAVAKGSVLGVQFHPEKSHRHGRLFLAAAVEMLCQGG